MVITYCDDNFSHCKKKKIVLLVKIEKDGKCKSVLDRENIENPEEKIISVIFHFKNLEGQNQQRCLTENTEKKIEQ